MYEHIGIEKNGKKLTKTDKVKNKVAYILDSVLPILRLQYCDTACAISDVSWLTKQRRSIARMVEHL